MEPDQIFFQNFILPDLSRVDIRTEHGANAYLQQFSQLGGDCLSNDAEEISKLCSKRQLNIMDQSKLVSKNMFVGFIAQAASYDVFRKHVTRNTIMAWLNLLTEQIKKFTTNRDWINTGKLPYHDTILFDTCTGILRHAVPTVLAFEGEFFAAVADFVKARKGKGQALPCEDVGYTFTAIVANSYLTSTRNFDNPWTTEKVLKKLEATGILEQFLRCVTVPETYESLGPPLHTFLDEFQHCIPFVSKKLKPGQPCGDVINAILEGRDGSKVKHPAVLNKLRTMMRLASSVDPEHKFGDLNKICRNCGKLDGSDALMRCARCQGAWYCSKECQRADWKLHKTICAPRTKQEMAKGEDVKQTLNAFVLKNFVHIIVRACEETGVAKKDMIVELDFTANENGVVPTMQDQPEFKVAPVRDYIEGSRPAEPDWFGKNDDQKEYKKNLKDYLSLFKQCYRKMNSDKIMFLVRFEGGFSVDSAAGPLFSEDAFLAFKAYMGDDHDDGPLSEIYGPELTREIKRELFKEYCIGDEETNEEMFRKFMSMFVQGDE